MMKKSSGLISSSNLLLVLLFLVFAISSCFIEIIEAQICYPSGQFIGKAPPPGQCNTQNDSECCVEGKTYPKYFCSPRNQRGILTLNSFQQGGDGGGEAACDGQYHSDETLVVALSTGWFNNRARCMKYITIQDPSNGNTAKAMVVDHCDSTVGCDAEHAYQPPCRKNIVDGSKAVWRALGVPEDQWGERNIVWYDA